MQTPDVTRVQIIGALLAAVYPVLVLLGIDLDATQKDAVDNLVGIGAALIGGDAIVRFGRSLAFGRGGIAEDVVDDADGPIEK